MVPKRSVGSFSAVDDVANVMTDLHNSIMWETSEYELIGFAGETTTPRVSNAK